jgi:MFS family permease
MRSKKATIIASAIIIGLLLLITPLIDSLVWAIVVLCVALGLIAVLQGQSWALTTDIVPDSHAARFGSIMNFGGYFGGALAPVLTGVLFDQWHTYAPSFIIAGVIALLGAVFYAFLVRKPIAPVRYDAPANSSH